LYKCLVRSRPHFYLKIEICYLFEWSVNWWSVISCLISNLCSLITALFFLQFPYPFLNWQCCLCSFVFCRQLPVLQLRTHNLQLKTKTAPLRSFDYSNVLKNFYRSLSQWTYNRNPAGFKFFNYLPRSRSGCKDGNKYVYMSSVIFTFFQCIFLVPNFQKTTPFFKGDTNVRRIPRPAKRNVKLIRTNA